MIGLRCANCGRSLAYAHAGKGYRFYGPTCAKKLGIKPTDTLEKPPHWLLPAPAPMPKPSRAVRRARSMQRRAVLQWGQLEFAFD